MTGLGLDCRVNSEGGRKGQTTGARFEPHHLTSGWSEQGLGGSAESTIARKFRDWSPTGDKSDQGYPHALHYGIQGMGDRGGDQAHIWDHHRLERGVRVEG